ncbi:hypothetical protein [Pseudoalteromonas sp. MMG005]|uniref:hypothetical protein n=1 Tax=Pseudoalteromonas sp. MMG005 TaxID=2822682 RepID=UPI001B3A4249|nr:hypothetical protein [Pseudoalteromonas sp. MMG005]MBQ4847311.1 hypothetical protein [Pseudoalteromonas sp. MMG005]
MGSPIKEYSLVAFFHVIDSEPYRAWLQLEGYNCVPVPCVVGKWENASMIICRTPNAAGFIHRGYGDAAKTGDINFEELANTIGETVDGLIDAADQPMGQTAPNPKGKGSRPNFRNSLSHRGNMTKRK